MTVHLAPRDRPGKGGIPYTVHDLVDTETVFMG